MFLPFDILKLFAGQNPPQGVIGTAQQPGIEDEEANPVPEQKNLLARFGPQDPDERAELSQMLLHMGAGMMAAGGPSKDPMNFGSAVGKGMQEGAKNFAEQRKASADIGSSRLKAKSEQVKLIQAQDAQNFASGMSTDGEGAYSISDLKKLHQRYLAMGEYAAANSLMERIQRLDDERRKDGLVQGPAGDYELAGGVAEGANEMERQKASGRVEGEELFKKTDDIREHEYGQDNPEFKTAQSEKTNAARQANRLQKTGAYIDPKSNRRFNGYFDSATGRTVYMDASNNPVDDPDVIDRMVEDTPGRTKANMSDPVTKDERSAEAALAQAAGRSQATVGVIDRMQGLSDDINKNSWFGTGGYNGTAKMLDAVLPGDNFSGSKRQELDNLMQEQIKQEIESLRGLGAMSDRDLAAIQDRVLNGGLNQAALKEIADRMRKISTYNASKYQAWKDSGQNDEFRQWSFKYDNDKYEGFMNPKKEQKQSEQSGAIVTGGDGVQYRFKGGDRNKKENWEPIL